MSTIDWTHYVDAIYCMHCDTYQSRMPRLEEELKKVDILGSPIFQYWTTHPDPSLYEKIDKMDPSHPDFHNDRRQVATQITFAYYDMFRMLKEQGYDKVLICEDDVVFHPDKSRLIGSLEHLPPDWDFIQFDRIFTPEFEHYLSSCEPYNGWFYQNYTGGYWGTAFTFWSKEAIKTAVDVLSTEFVPSDYILINRDDPKIGHLKRYIPTRYIVHQLDQDGRYYPSFF